MVPPVYQPRDPSSTVLYRVIAEHLEVSITNSTQKNKGFWRKAGDIGKGSVYDTLRNFMPSYLRPRRFPSLAGAFLDRWVALQPLLVYAK